MRAQLALSVLLSGVVCNSAAAPEVSRPSHLKFKQGPVCMCSTGLREKDIRDAEAARGDGRHATNGTTTNASDTSQIVERRNNEKP